MNPNLTIYAMAESIEREHREANAARGHLVAGATDHRPVRRPLQALGRSATRALHRAGTLLRGPVTTAGVHRPVACEETG
jgi:hypothetical protein